MTTQESYADKIAKLLRKAESTSSSHEAESLVAKAQELMTKYAIDEAMLAAARKGKPSADTIVTEEFVSTGNFLVAFGNLCHHLVQNNDCKAVLIQNSPRTIGDKTFKNTYILKVTGFKSDVDRIRLLYTSLHVQAVRFEGAWWKENKIRYAHPDLKRQGFLDRRQFLFSYADRIGERVAEGKAAGIKAAQKEHGTGMELVLASKAEKVLAKYEEMYPNLRTVKQRQQGGSYHSHEAGREAGGRADLGDPKLANQRAAGKQLNR
jgi:hypothetical protein